MLASIPTWTGTSRTRLLEIEAHALGGGEGTPLIDGSLGLA